MTKLWRGVILLMAFGFMTTANAAESDFSTLQKMMRDTPKAAQQLETQGKSDEAGALYLDLAHQAEKSETMPRKIFSPHAFGLYAEFLNRKGKQAESIVWYEKIATLSANAHAYQTQASYLRQYADLLRKKGDGARAQKIEKLARTLSETQKRLNDSGLDY